MCTFLLFFFVFSGCTRGNLDCTVLQFCVPIKKQTLLTKELVVLGSVQTNFIKNSNQLESNQMAQGHLSNCCTSSSCFERSCFLQSIRGSSNPRENGRSSFRLKLHAYPSIICRQFVVVRASLPPHHHHPSSSSSLTSAATSSFSSNKTLQCPPPHGLLLRYTSLSRRTGGFVPCNAARSSALSESEEMMPTTSRRVTDNRLPQLVDVVPPVVEFKLSDFELCSHVSVGLAGRVSVFIFPLFLFMSALF